MVMREAGEGRGIRVRNTDNHYWPGVTEQPFDAGDKKESSLCRASGENDARGTKR